MERSCSTRVFSVLLLMLFIAIISTEIGILAEARTCESQSHKFKGICVSDTNCASVCKTEGFSGGDCHGFRRRCFCITPCAA